MDRATRDCLVKGYETLIPALDLPDPDDRHVLAAAVRCGARHIVIDNLADFPTGSLSGFDIEAIDADAFLARTFDRHPAEAFAVLRALRKIYRNPPFSPDEFILDLTAKGLRLCRWRHASAQTHEREARPGL